MTALAANRDVATSSSASNARAAWLTVLRPRPVMTYGILRLPVTVPKTASISGAASSRFGVTTTMSPGRGGLRPAKRPSSASCSTSSSRVSE